MPELLAKPPAVKLLDPVSPNVQTTPMAGSCGCGCGCFCGSGNQTHISSDNSQSNVQVTYIAASIGGTCGS